jgi:hypothetical protein
MAAKTAVATQEIGRLTPTHVTFAAAAAGGNHFLADGRTSYWIINGGASPCIVTIASVPYGPLGRKGDPAAAPQTFTVPAGETWAVPPLPSEGFNQVSGEDLGFTTVDYNQVTSVTVAAVRDLRV